MRILGLKGQQKALRYPTKYFQYCFTENMVNYHISTKTGHVTGGGTDADVFVLLTGQNGETGKECEIFLPSFFHFFLFNRHCACYVDDTLPVVIKGGAQLLKFQFSTSHFNESCNPI